MLRPALAGAVVALSLLGCATTSSQGGDTLAAEAPAGELARLARLVGSWNGTAEFVSVPPAMAEQMPAGEDPPVLTGGWESSWALGGHFLRQAGWHDMGDGSKAHYVEYVGWDSRAKKFRAAYFDDNGDMNQGWWTMNPDGSIRVEVQGRRQGAAYSGRGTMRFVDDNTVDWNWTETGPQGRMEMKGTGTRAQ